MRNAKRTSDERSTLNPEPESGRLLFRRPFLPDPLQYFADDPPAWRLAALVVSRAAPTMAALAVLAKVTGWIS